MKPAHKNEGDVWEELDSSWAPVSGDDLEFIRRLIEDAERESLLPKVLDGEPLVKRAKLQCASLRACPPPLMCLSATRTDSLLEVASSRGGIDEVFMKKLVEYLQVKEDDEKVKFERYMRKRSAAPTDLPADLSAVIGMVDKNCPLFSLEASDLASSKAVRELALRMVALGPSADYFRWYEDLWEEQDFCAKRHLHVQPIPSWSYMFHNYSPDEDNAYIEWHLRQRKRFTQQQSALAMSSSSKFRAASSSRALPIFLSPPVPVSSHHPACWGPNSRRNPNVSNGVLDIDVKLVHPACVSNTKISNSRIKRSSDGSSKVGVVSELEIASSVASDRLAETSRLNYCKLLSIEKKMRHAMKLQGLISFRDSLSKGIETLCADVMIPTSARNGCNADNVSYMHIASVSSAAFKNSDRRNSPNAVLASISDVAGEFAPQSSALLQNLGQPHQICLRNSESLPTSQMYAVHGSDFIRNLQCGSFIELLTESKWMKNPTWILAKVLKVYCDGKLLRFVKVQISLYFKIFVGVY
jgi:hypothetical protein